MKRSNHCYKLIDQYKADCSESCQNINKIQKYISTTENVIRELVEIDSKSTNETINKNIDKLRKIQNALQTRVTKATSCWSKRLEFKTSCIDLGYHNEGHDNAIVFVEKECLEQYYRLLEYTVDGINELEQQKNESTLIQETLISLEDFKNKYAEENEEDKEDEENKVKKLRLRKSKKKLTREEELEKIINEDELIQSMLGVKLFESDFGCLIGDTDNKKQLIEFIGIVREHDDHPLMIKLFVYDLRHGIYDYVEKLALIYRKKDAHNDHAHSRHIGTDTNNLMKLVNAKLGENMGIEILDHFVIDNVNKLVLSPIIEEHKKWTKELFNKFKRKQIHAIQSFKSNKGSVAYVLANKLSKK
jgi:guanylate kinase